MNLTITSELPSVFGKRMTRVALIGAAMFTMLGAVRAGVIADIPFGTATDFTVLSLDQSNPVPAVAQAIADAKNAAAFSYGFAYDFGTLKPTGSVYSGFTIDAGLANTTISSDLTISRGSVGKYAFTLGGIDLGSNETLTLSAPFGSKVVVSITGAFLVNGGKIVLTGGLHAKDVLYRLIGNSTPSNSGVISGGGKVTGSILAPGRNVAILGNSFVKGHVIAKTVTVSGNSQVVSPEF
jgi:hypothetical protein